MPRGAERYEMCHRLRGQTFVAPLRQCLRSLPSLRPSHELHGRFQCPLRSAQYLAECAKPYFCSARSLSARAAIQTKAPALPSSSELVLFPESSANPIQTPLILYSRGELRSRFLIPIPCLFSLLDSRSADSSPCPARRRVDGSSRPEPNPAQSSDTLHLPSPPGSSSGMVPTFLQS
jgi:hypothetical protein